MSIISRVISGWCPGKVAGMTMFVIGALLTACGDFHGPWEYYPHTTEIYTGVYTYGYIIEGESPRICFSNWTRLRRKILHFTIALV